jgi:RNA polymerase sigma-70 factor (ECF subfamily)
MDQDRQESRTRLDRLIAGQYAVLLAFFRRRIRNRTDAADLAQEVYVRMLRVNEPESIRDPQAYLFAVAGNLVKEQLLLDHRQALGVGVDEAAAVMQLIEVPDFEQNLDQRDRLRRLRAVLEQLPLKCRTVVALQYRHGLNHQEVADQLGISTHMVKKYLAQALAHCRRRMQRLA